MRRRSVTSITIVICIAAVLLACAGCGTPSASSGASGATSGQFPLTVHSGDGSVTIPSRPTRILCLSASATEMLYAIGAGRQVAGVDKYSSWPSDAPRTSFTGYETSAEDYLPEHPDLVIVAFNTGQLVAQLKALHIPVLLLAPAKTIASAEAQITELGAATGHPQSAASTNSALNSYISHAVTQAGGRERGATYYIEIDPTYYSATSSTFIGAVFARFGMRNIADKASAASSGYPQLSAEYVLTADPDYVFLADTVCCGQTANSFATRPGYSNLRAVRTGHVIPVNDSVASEWGPHSLDEFVTVVADVISGRTPPSADS